jgi:hypothetical protein
VTPSILGTFELDGNATTGVLGTSGSTTTSHDWDQVFADAGSPAAVPSQSSFGHGSTSGALAGSFINDQVNSNSDDIFTGGGSKDTQGLQSGPWLFTGGKPQGKNDITHAFAAAYTDPSNGDLLLYAGLDRFDNSGDATAGFWFFVNPNAEGAVSKSNGTGPFTGTHHDGDVLLVSDFTIGGSVSTIAVYRWTGNDSTGSLQFVGGNSSNTFAIVNGAPISVPWSYTNKSGQSQPQAGEFLEEGVDLTALGLGGCFTTFLAETRSSQSPTATLSDFAVGTFPLCSLAAPQFTGLSKVGDPVTYPLTVQNTGAMPLFIQSVTDSLLGNIVVNHTLKQPGDAGVNQFVTKIDAGGFNFSTPLAPGASLTIFVTRTVQASDPDPTPDTVTFAATDDLAGTDTQITATAINSVNLFQPSAALTETASPTSATQLGQVITYTFTVTNTSSSDSPNLVLDLSNPNDSFTDTLLGNLEADAIHAFTGNSSATVASIPPGASFTFTEQRAIQAGDPNPLTDTANAAFTLAQNLGSFSNIIHASSSASVTLVPHLEITKAPTGGIDMVQPGDTASFTITVTNDGAGPATNVVVTDQLPDADRLSWNASSSAFTSSIDASGLLTATDPSLAAGASATIIVSAVVPLDFFGSSGTGTGNGDPVPLDLFELDGNATTGVLGTSGSTTTSHDWDQVFADNQTTPPGTTSGAVASSFVTDQVNLNSDDIFTGGGSKDTNGLQDGPWLFSGGKPQGKDDIAHAFAGDYTDTRTGDQILYAGLDRFDNSGDATAGFWFFVNPVGEGAISKSNGTGPFTGTHSDGDILLVSDFTIGGSTSTIKVFRWTGNDSTGSLVPLNNGNPINGSTFAIVNGSPITVPWSFTDKSHNRGPAAGEFLEEGINLSALGLQGCFSSFLAETRSSQSPTATLSDFVLGKFNTCMATLPNTATVQADGIAPITSNQAVITITDGHALEATSSGPGVSGSSLTDAQLQPLVAQAVNYWRGAGVAAEDLHALDNVSVQLAGLAGGELGLEAPGHIWIDRTAAGWGWSVTGGQMDLLSVVTHEVGHALGFEHSETGVMAATLAPGVQRLPEAHPAPAATSAGVSSGSAVSVATPPAVAPISFSVGEIKVAQPSVSPFTSPPTVTVDAVLALTRGVTPAAIVQDGPGSHASVVRNVALPAPDSTAAPVPGLRPPSSRVESGSGSARDTNDVDEQTGALFPMADLTGALSRQQARDAIFASDACKADLADTALILLQDSAPVTSSIFTAALALALGAWWTPQREESDSRKEQPRLSNSI